MVETPQSPERYNFDVDFQKKILALMVRDPKFVEHYQDVLLPTYFSYEVLGTLCRLVLGYYHRYKAPPTSVAAKTLVMEHVNKYGVDDQLAGEFWSVVSELYAMDLLDADFIRDRVVQFGRQMAIRKALLAAAKLAQEWGDLEQIEALMRNALATGQGIGDYGMNLYSVMPQLPAMYRESVLAHRVRTGWPTLDECLGGGLGGGEIGFVLAGSGQGKSAILVNFAAVAVECRVPVVYITHELQELDVASRITARLTGLPEFECRRGGPAYDDLVGRLVRNHRYLRIKYMNPGTTPAAIRSYLSRVAQVDGVRPGLIIHDYIDELSRSDRKSYGNRYEDVGVITSELIVIAKDFGCPLWTASQLNRGGFYSDMAGAESVSDSFLKITKADAVLVLNQTREQHLAGEGVCRLDKIRRGAGQRAFPLRFEYARMLVVQAQLPQGAPA